MTARAEAMTYGGHRQQRGLLARFLASSFVAVTVVVFAIIVVWYVGAVLLNANAQNVFDKRDNVAARPPLARIGGQLVASGDPLDPAFVEAMVLPHVPERLATLLDRDGSCDFALDEAALGRLRVNVSRQRTGLKASMRFIRAEIPDLASLGLPEATGLPTLGVYP